jgi:hypothetical protein
MSDPFSQTEGEAIVRAKNTFLEFRFCSYKDSGRARRLSAPACIARPNADEEMWSLDMFKRSEDHVLWISDNFEANTDAGQNPIQDDILEEENYHGHLVLQTSEIPSITSNGVQEKSQEGKTLCECTEQQTGRLCTSLPIPGRAIMSTKATFLDFKFIAYGDSPRCRRYSVPSCFGFRGIDEDMWRAKASTLDSCDRVLWTSEDIIDGNQNVLAYASSEISWNAASEGHTSCLGAKRKSPSKEKRDKTRQCRVRHKKFISHLCEQVDRDPAAFDIASIRWPPSLIDHPESREYLVDILEAHRAKALQSFATKSDM